MRGITKPTALHIAAGTYRKHRHEGRLDAQVDVSTPPKPAHLTGDASDEWDRTVERLTELGIINAADAPAIEAYCVAYATWRKANAAVAKEGQVIEAANGIPMPNPWVAIANKAADQMNRFHSQFGGTPAARTRVQATGKKKTDSAKSRFFAD